MKPTFYVLCCCIPVLGWTGVTYASNTHVYKGFTDWGGVTREYHFFDIPEESGYLTAFPVDEIKEKISDEQIKSIKLEYRVFTSIADAELAMVELLEMSSLYMHNIMDVPLPNGQIGDNCWHQLQVGAIHFIRKNTLVSITPNSFDRSGDFSFIEVIARKIDSVLVNY